MVGAKRKRSCKKSLRVFREKKLKKKGINENIKWKTIIVGKGEKEGGGDL